jgi:hypothetical protein
MLGLGKALPNMLKAKDTWSKTEPKDLGLYVGLDGGVMVS